MPVFVPHGPEGLIGALLYVGPDQLMPLASVFGAIVGVALMFWHRLVAFVRKCLGLFRRRGQVSQGEPPVEDRA
ncbi:MAG TPA: hypothetical protein VF424_11615 [Vicinamibacterales bacterium]